MIGAGDVGQGVAQHLVVTFETKPPQANGPTWLQVAGATLRM